MNQQICTVHNEPALYCEEDAQQNQVFLCRFCVQQRLKITGKDNDNDDNEVKQALKQLEMKFDQSIQYLKDFAQLLSQFTQQILYELQKFKQQVEEHQSHLMEKKNQLKIFSNDFHNLQQNIINDQKNLINNSLAQIILQINDQMKELEVSAKLDQLYQFIQLMSKQNQMDQIKKITVMENKFEYQMIQQSPYKQNEFIYAIAFNKDNSIMIAGCDKIIKVFEFQNEKLKELQQLSGHSKNIYCLKFMKKSNQFVSGSSDKTMIIWKQNRKKQWQCIQVIKEHSNQIFCVTINQNEDLLISGSFDMTVKFWGNQNNNWSCIQSIDCQGWVYSISLNNQEDQLIASVLKKQILVIQLNNNYWTIKQQISVEQYGQRLCFINQNQFVFQPYNNQHLQIFDYDAKNLAYKKGQELQYQNEITGDDALFPIQYISQIGLIIVKNNHHSHLIKRNQDGQFTVEQSIYFNTPFIYGCMTDDGRYIATWDYESKEIQIRKFEI